MKLSSTVFKTVLVAGYLLLLDLVGATTSQSQNCTKENTRVRKEWGSLTKPERTEYINAVLCMQSLPATLNSTLVPGAKTRLDDFVATHINQTLSIHLDGIFLSWHRQFVWLWETALQEECGYKGAQPYWNWALWNDDLAGSPLFDGSETSLSGDGTYEPWQGNYSVGNSPNETLPHGTGGGCVIDGPFKNQTINFGPFEFNQVFTGLPSNWSAFAPHCLSRDLNNYIATRYTSQSKIDILMNTTTIADFQDTMSGADLNLGVHGGGHFSIGLSLQDFFVSPADPAFFLHHGMIDRVWLLWQEQDPESRVWSFSGTSTIFNGNETADVTADTLLNWGVLAAGEKRVGELVRVGVKGLCYVYV